MSAFSDQFELAEKTRETIDPGLALPMFGSVLELADSPEAKMSVSLQIGLCYEHLEQHADALTQYEAVLKQAQKSGNLLYQVFALRHKVSAMLESGQSTQALAESHAMLKLMEKLAFRPAAAGWIIHGHIKALKQNGSPRDIVAKHAWQEMKDLWYAHTIGVDSLKFWVWTTGLLTDMAYGFAPIGWVLYLPAYLIVVIRGLTLRKGQFKKGFGKKRI